MLKIDDIIHITYGQSMMIGKIKRIGSLEATADKLGPGPPYILIKEICVMVPVAKDQFNLIDTKKELYFTGGQMISVLKMTDELFKNYIQVTSGLIISPGSPKGMTN